MPTPIRPDYWAAAPDDVLAGLDASRDGLTTSEAQRRLARHGRNSVAPPSGYRLLHHVLARLTEPLVAILLVAALISGVTGDWVSCAIIVGIVTASVGLDVTQSQRAEAAAEALRRSVALRARVLRDGEPRETPAEEVVPGDIVDLEAGDLVPADGIVLASHAAQVNEALLTGEPYPVGKRPGPDCGREPGRRGLGRLRRHGDGLRQRAHAGGGDGGAGAPRRHRRLPARRAAALRLPARPA